MNAPTSRFLRAEDMRRMAAYEFAPRSTVEGYFSGKHRSPLRGSSTEFRDYRAFSQGDDPSRVDWRVVARTDRFYVRNFHEETSANCHIMLDCSASMGFGKPDSKLEFASRFVAALAFLVASGKDRFSLTLFDDKIRDRLPSGSTGVHLQSALEILERAKPGRETALADALRAAAPQLRERGTLVVLSDFLCDPAPAFEALNIYLHRGFRVVLFQVLDPDELELPDSGLVAFEDLETGERVTAHTRDIRSDYNRAIDEHVRNVRQLARRRQIHHEVARTDSHHFNLFDVLVNRIR